MKLIQQNILMGVMGFRFLEFMQRQKADILMLQEVASSPEGKSGFFDVLQNLQRDTGMEHVFFSPSRNWRLNDKLVYYGNAILAVQPLSNAYQEFTNLSYKECWDCEKHDDNIRLFQHAIATTPKGQKLNLLNYHGYCQDNGAKEGNALTETHCRRLADYISQLKGPVILAGDFNLAPSSPSLAPLNALLRNLCLENDVQTTRNSYAFVMDTVDYIWVSPDVIVNHFEVLPDVVSDHAALLLEFEV